MTTPLSADAPHPATRYWPLVLAATAMLMITMGVRQSMGLFVAPIGQSTGLTVAQISFALAIGQFVWGAVQPVFGAIADQRGPGRVLVFGGLLLAAGMALAPALASEWGLLLTLGVLSAAGAGAGSFSILIGATAQHMPAEKRSMAAGVINAGGSFGHGAWRCSRSPPPRWRRCRSPGRCVAARPQPRTRLRMRRRHPASACVSNCASPCAIAATGCCTWGFSPAGCTSRSS
jgi:sugar phosphate permease